MCFGTSINDILKNYEKKAVLIKYEYTKLNRKKVYREEYLADFEQISHFLVYISEIDELSNEVKKSTNELSKKLTKIENEVISFRNLNEDYFRNTVIQKKKIARKNPNFFILIYQLNQQLHLKQN